MNVVSFVLLRDRHFELSGEGERDAQQEATKNESSEYNKNRSIKK